MPAIICPEVQELAPVVTPSSPSWPQLLLLLALLLFARSVRSQYFGLDDDTVRTVDARFLDVAHRPRS